jgi:hypothetical protein
MRPNCLEVSSRPLNQSGVSSSVSRLTSEGASAVIVVSGLDGTPTHALRIRVEAYDQVVCNLQH